VSVFYIPITLKSAYFVLFDILNSLDKKALKVCTLFM
jgi:hypothetical protein